MNPADRSTSRQITGPGRRPLLAWAAILSLASTAGAPAQQPSSAGSNTGVAATLLKQPLRFELRADSTSLLSRTGSRAIQIQPGGDVQFTAPVGQSGAGQQTGNVFLRLQGGSAKSAPAGARPLPGYTNYLLGNDPSRWRKHVEQFAAARVDQIYPGIDLIYYGNGEHLEHDYTVAPGADPKLISMRFEGAKARIDAATGDLVVEQQEEFLRLHRPVSYQQLADNTRQPVESSFERHADGSFGFALGSYDRGRPLTIDPVITYGTYFGGTNSDYLVDLKLDSAGNMYLLLTTQSIDLPVKGQTSAGCIGTCGPNGPNTTSPITPDYYLAKLDPTGRTLLLATYLGGSNADYAANLALDTDGTLYIYGDTQSLDFPTVKGVYTTAPPDITGGMAGPTDSAYHPGTLTRLSADGSTILYSTYFGYGILPYGVSTQPSGHLLALAGNGVAYIAGSTGNEFNNDFSMASNALYLDGANFVAKIDTTKTGAASLLYATPVGPVIPADHSTTTGHNSAYISGIGVDSRSDLWIAGYTANSTFPQTNLTGQAVPSYQVTCGYVPQCQTTFLVELNPSGTSQLYSTFLGGSTNSYGGPGVDNPSDMVIDANDNIYIAGYTGSVDFPTVNAAYTWSQLYNSYFSGNDGYIARFSSGGGSLLYSTLLLGTPVGIAANAASSPGLVAYGGTFGYNYYPQKNGLPYNASVYAHSMPYDGVFGLFDTTKSGSNSLLISTYLGASDGGGANLSTTVNRVTFDANNNLLLGGSVYGNVLPTVNPFQTTCDQCSYQGNSYPDGFLTRVQTIAVSPTSLTFPSTYVATTATATATITNLMPQAISISTGAFSTGNPGDFAESDTCGGIVPASGTCTLNFTLTPTALGARSTVYTVADSLGIYAPFTVSLAGTGLADPTITLSPSPLPFSTRLPYNDKETLTVTASGSAVTQGSMAISGPDAALFSFANYCSTKVIQAGASCNVIVTFTPTVTGTFHATFTMTDNAVPNNTQSVALVGTATGYANISLSANSLTFTAVAGTSSAAQNIVVSNTGYAPATFNYANIVYGTVFSESTNCGTTIPAQTSCNVSVTYSPTAAGSNNDYIYISTSASYNLVTVSGTATAGVSMATLSTAALAFGEVNSGDSATQQVTLTNSGGATLNLASISIAGSAAFTETTTCGTTLASKASCSVNVIFTPGAVGAQAATLTYTDDSGGTTGSTQTVALTGAGMSAPYIFIANTAGSVSSLFGDGTAQSSAVSGGGIGAAVDRNGLVFSITADGTGVSIFNDDGTLVNTTIGLPIGSSALAIDGGDQLWIASPGSVSMGQILGSSHASIADPTLQKPSGVAIDLSGNVWISDSQSNTVHEIVGGGLPTQPLANAVTSKTPGTEPQ